MKNIYLLFILGTFISFSSCKKEDWKKDKVDYAKEKESCVELVYPISYTMPDGTELIGEENEIWTAIKAWYEANPDIETKAILNYPVEVVLKDGTLKSINDDAEMILAKGDCEDKDKDDLELCEWDETVEASGPSFEKIIVKDLVESEDCGCIVSGMEKYLENGQTRFLIYYKYEECEGYGYKVVCENGDCEDAEKCKFFQDCDGN